MEPELKLAVEGDDDTAPWAQDLLPLYEKMRERWSALKARRTW
jgi:hypothetical protein